jgi:hypothetical protein
MGAFRVEGAAFLAFLERLPRVPVQDGDRMSLSRSAVVDHGNSFSIYFCDPDGNPIELTTYDHSLVAARRLDQDAVSSAAPTKGAGAGRSRG